MVPKTLELNHQHSEHRARARARARALHPAAPLRSRGGGGWVGGLVRLFSTQHLIHKKKIISGILENKLLIWCSFYGLCICIAGCGRCDQRSR